MNTKTFRLFISSTFSDFKAEREVLHKKVFPKVQKACGSEFQFQPIDLRWGVNNESQLDQKTLDMCLDEVKACKGFPHPHFLIMTGDRYGYIPLPYMIEAEEYEKIEAYVESHDELLEIMYKPYKKSGAEKEVRTPSRQIRHSQLLKQWYRLDTNQIPASYVLQKRESAE